MNIAEFADYLYGRGKAERTVAEYAKWLRRLTVYAADHGHTPATVPAHLIRRWADDTVPPSWSSRKQAKTAMHHYAKATGRTDEPWEAIRVPRKPRPRPQPHDAAEAALLRDAALLYGGRRGLAVLCLLYTGARPGEVSGMRWDWLDLRAGTIRWWRTKGSDDHELPLAPVLHRALTEARPHDGSVYIFSGNNGRAHVSGTTVWEWTKAVAATAGLDTYPRRLRATLANAVLEATHDLDAAAAILGHRSVETTRNYYTDTSMRRLEAAITAPNY